GGQLRQRPHRLPGPRRLRRAPARGTWRRRGRRRRRRVGGRTCPRGHRRPRRPGLPAGAAGAERGEAGDRTQQIERSAAGRRVRHINLHRQTLSVKKGARGNYGITTGSTADASSARPLTGACRHIGDRGARVPLLPDRLRPGAPRNPFTVNNSVRRGVPFPVHNGGRTSRPRTPGRPCGHGPAQPALGATRPGSAPRGPICPGRPPPRAADPVAGGGVSGQGSRPLRRAVVTASRRVWLSSLRIAERRELVAVSSLRPRWSQVTAFGQALATWGRTSGWRE